MCNLNHVPILFLMLIKFILVYISIGFYHDVIFMKLLHLLDIWIYK